MEWISVRRIIISAVTFTFISLLLGLPACPAMPAVALGMHYDHERYVLCVNSREYGCRLDMGIYLWLHMIAQLIPFHIIDMHRRVRNLFRPLYISYLWFAILWGLALVGWFVCLYLPQGFHHFLLFLESLFFMESCFKGASLIGCNYRRSWGFQVQRWFALDSQNFEGFPLKQVCFYRLF